MLGNTAIKAPDGHNYMAQAASSAMADPLPTCAGPAFFEKDRIVFTDCPFDSEKLTRHIRGTLKSWTALRRAGARRSWNGNLERVTGKNFVT